MNVPDGFYDPQAMVWAGAGAIAVTGFVSSRQKTLFNPFLKGSINRHSSAGKLIFTYIIACMFSVILAMGCHFPASDIRDAFTSGILAAHFLHLGHLKTLLKDVK